MRRASAWPAVVLSLGAAGLLAASPPPAQGGPAGAPRTVAVMDFDNRSSRGEWQWLGKGLADMLITDLAASRQLVIVERERLHVLTSELDLGRTGLVDRKTAARVGELAAVDWVLFGSYLKAGDDLKIEAHLLDLKTQRLLRVEWVEGRAADVFKLEKTLVRQLLERLRVPLTEAERKSLAYVPTDSIPAFEHYSLSLDAFDKGDWHRALLECRLAVKADRGFLKAAARLADVYAQLGEPEHALIEYRRLIAADKDNVLPESVYYKMGRLLESVPHGIPEAVHAYQRIVARHPEYARAYDFREPVRRAPSTSRADWVREEQVVSLRALERLGLLHERSGDTFEAAQRYSQVIFYLGTRHWANRFLADVGRRVSWRYAPLYWRFVRENRSATLCPPRPGQVILADGWKTGTDVPRSLRPAGLRKDSRLVVAPPDKEIAEIVVEVHASRWVSVRWHEPRPGGTAVVRDRKEFQLSNRWETVRFEATPGIRAASVVVASAARWRMTFRLRPWSRIIAADAKVGGQVFVNLKPEWTKIVLDGHTYERAPRMRRGGDPFWHRGRPTMILNPYAGDKAAEIHWADGRREVKRFHLKPKGNVSLLFDETDTALAYRTVADRGSNLFLFVDRGGKTWCLWDNAYALYRASSANQESDLFWATSSDGRTWTPARRLSVSSTFMDMYPVLQQDRRGVYWLFWLSSRDPDDPQCFWISSSRDGVRWSFPRKVVLHVSDLERRRRGGLNFPSFGFTVDTHNTFWLTAGDRLFRSEDAIHWKPVEHLAKAGGPRFARGWWAFGRYALTHDRAGDLLLAATGEATGGKRASRRQAVWSRSHTGRWEMLAPLDKGLVSRGCLHAADRGFVAVMVEGNTGLVLRRYEESHGWRSKVRIENCLKDLSFPCVAVLPDGRCIVAFACKNGIIAAVCNLPGPEQDEKQ